MQSSFITWLLKEIQVSHQLFLKSAVTFDPIQNFAVQNVDTKNEKSDEKSAFHVSHLIMIENTDLNKPLHLY